MTSKSQSPKDQPDGDPLDLPCPHCAVSQFLMQWQEIHNCSNQLVASKMAEVLCDVLLSIDLGPERSKVILQVTAQLSSDFTSLVCDLYKSDQVALLDAYKNGEH